jgi:hypothetical protein
MLRKLIPVAAWALLAFFAYATISPIQVRPTLPVPTSFEHLTAFAVLGLLFCLAYPRHIALVCLIVLGSAVLLEIMQLLTPDRHGRIQDAIEKMAGGVLGIVAGRVILCFVATVCGNAAHTIREMASPKRPQSRRVRALLWLVDNPHLRYGSYRSAVTIVAMKEGARPSRRGEP